MEWTIRLEARTGWGEVTTCEIGALHRSLGDLTADGVGLGLAEAKALLAELQQRIVQSQIDEYVTCARVCRDCLKLRRLRDQRTRTLQTLFGTVKVAAPRIRMCTCVDTRDMFDVSSSPLSHVLPDRCTAELRRLQAELGARHSFREATRLLETFLPCSPPNHASVRNRLHRVASRIEAIDAAAPQVPAVPPRRREARAEIVVMIDGAHLRAGDGPSRAVREYLTALEESNPTGDDFDDSPGPSTSEKNISLTDPAAQWTAAPGGPAFYAYSTNYLIDLQAGIIVDVEAMPAHRTSEVESTKTMIDRVEERFGIKPRRLVGDTAYGTGPMLGWMVEDKGISPHVPVWDRSERKDGTLSSSEFRWNEQANEYRCPQGHALLSDRRHFIKPRTRITKARTIIYSASQQDCMACPMKQQCCPNMLSRKITRSVHERSRDVARELADTPQYKQSRRDRKKVEMLFAHLKRILKLDRLRLRGLSGAHDEFLMAATAQNLRRMAKRLMPSVHAMEIKRA